MRMVSAAALTLIALCAGSAGAEDLKAFKLTIDGVAVDIDPDVSTMSRNSGFTMVVAWAWAAAGQSVRTSTETRTDRRNDRNMVPRFVS